MKIRKAKLRDVKQLKIIGMTNLLYTISTCLGARVGIIEDVVFLPKYRDKGYGSKLFSHVIKYAGKKGAKRLSLLTDSDNLKAQRFYKKHGFERSSMVQFRR